MTVTGTSRRWPLALISLPAAVSIWAGWVGLGGLCGFGVIHPLPGILPGFQLNTAITLPIGVEAYAAYALGAWMSPAAPPQARRFARWSALGALAYGMAGLVIYHLLAAAHATEAPWPVVVVVSCMPVAVLGLAAALTHLLGMPAAGAVPGPDTPVPALPSGLNGHGEAAAELFAAELARGEVPGVRRIRRELRVGQPRATEVRDYLAEMATTSGQQGR
jgi:hypothetical protein